MIVFFVADLPTSRCCKLASGLRALGHQVHLLHRDDPWASRKCFDSEQKYGSVDDLRLSLRWAIFADVFHVFSNWSYQAARTVIETGRKVVFDDYDVLSGDAELEVCAASAIPDEEWCIRNAGGLASRDDQILAAIEKGVRPKLKEFIPDSCWGDCPRVPVKLSSHDGKRHVVYCGNSLGGGNEPGEEVTTQIVRAASSCGGVFHVFLRRDDLRRELDERMRSVIAREKLDPSSLEVHRGVPCDELPTFMSAFDVGLLPYFGVCTNQRMERGCGNKAYDYLDAGLPMVLFETRGLGETFMERNFRESIKRVNIADDIFKIEPFPVSVPERLRTREVGKNLVSLYEKVIG